MGSARWPNVGQEASQPSYLWRGIIERMAGRAWIAVGLLLGSAASACNGFREVPDGAVGDGPRSDRGPVDMVHDTPPATEQGLPSDGPRPEQGNPPDGASVPDWGDKLPAGECCGKGTDCASGMCWYLGTGPTYCSKTCTTSPDNCPVGFFCSPQNNACVPPEETYSCGPQVAVAKPQPFGGCCGKKEDCLSGHCLVVGTGQYFCSQACTRSPDNCPTKYLCSLSLLCVTTADSTCAYK